MPYGCLIVDVEDLFFFDKKTNPRVNSSLINFLRALHQEFIILILVSKEYVISLDKETENIVYFSKEISPPIKYCTTFPWAISIETFISSQNASLAKTIQKELETSLLATEQHVIISSKQDLLDECKKFGCETQITFWEGTLHPSSIENLEKKLATLKNDCEIEFLYDIDDTLVMLGASKNEERTITNKFLIDFLNHRTRRFTKAIHSILSSRPDLFAAFITILSDLKQRASTKNISIPEIANFEITYKVSLYDIIYILLTACNKLTEAYNSDPNYDAKSDTIFTDCKEALKKNDDQLLCPNSTFMILTEFQEQTGIQLDLNELSFTGGKISKKSIVEKKCNEYPNRLLVVFEDLFKNILDLADLENVIGIKVMREDDFQKPLLEKLKIIKENQISNSQGDEETSSRMDLKAEKTNASDDELDISTQEKIDLQENLQEFDQQAGFKKRELEIEESKNENLKRTATAQTAFFEPKRSKTQKTMPQIIINDDDEFEEDREKIKSSEYHS